MTTLRTRSRRQWAYLIPSAGTTSSFSGQLDFRPVLKIPEERITGTPRAQCGSHVKESAKYIVVHAGDLSRFLAALPWLARQAEIEIDFLIVVHDPQRGPGYDLIVVAGGEPVGKPDLDSFRAEGDSDGVVGIVEEKQARLALRFDLDVGFDGVRMAADRRGQHRCVLKRLAAGRRA